MYRTPRIEGRKNFAKACRNPLRHVHKFSRPRRKQAGNIVSAMMRKALDWVRDYGHMARGVALMYLHHRPPAHYRGYIVEGKTPVILLSGLAHRWAFLKPLGDFISLRGHPTYIESGLRHNLENIPELAKRVRALIEREDMRNAVIVAHSKGGLIGKYVLA